MIVSTDSVTMPEYDRTAMTYTSHDNLEKAAQCAGACVEQRVVDGEDQVGHHLPQQEGTLVILPVRRPLAISAPNPRSWQNTFIRCPF